MAGKRVTIRDVAKSAGVSYQTVSRALNDKGEIDGTTKQRVLDTARELGYRPSRFARGLVRQDTTSIGLVIPDLMNPFFTEVASAALTSARKKDWHVVVYDTADDPAQELSTLTVIGSQVDAIVGYLSLPEHVIDQHTSGLPVVHIGRAGTSPASSSIQVDGEDGVHAAVSIARELNGKAPKRFRFGYIHAPVSLGRRDAVIQFTRPDDTPKRFSLRGKVAVWYKETVSSSPWPAFLRMKKHPGLGSLAWRRGGRYTR
ncbi:LacI family DNA-binding transcriptional regulator [Kibdelosporangium lantanae]|uniref:LacI family DNA-binding transcriptional regulator n=1 Tax=Kibdelosporangium lantanae TaxID=1497396 RepID=A0ABW3M4S4_9PSEU